MWTCFSLNDSELTIKIHYYISQTCFSVFIPIVGCTIHFRTYGYSSKREHSEVPLRLAPFEK